MILADHNAPKRMNIIYLARGAICRTMPPWATHDLFTGKEDSNNQPCFDYQELNTITVKNKYPRLLIMELIDSLLEAKTCTELDLCNMDRSIRVAKGDK